MTASNNTSMRHKAANRAPAVLTSSGQGVKSPIVRFALPTEQPVASVPGGRGLRIWRALRGPYPTLLSRLVVGAVFLVAGVSKALDMPAFAAEISAYQITPEPLVQPLAIALPLLELLIGVYLLIGLMQRWSAMVAAMFLIGFIGAMALALARGLTLDCGCFGNALGVGILRETVGPSSILRDVLYLALSVHLIVVPGIWSVDWLRQRRA